MENTNEIIKLLSEWVPLSDLHEKLPAKIQKGLFHIDVNVTCLDVLPEFIAIGSDCGIAFWYNRKSGDIQKLRSEISSPITCIKIVSSVEYMIAAGSECGQVSIFQIQKELPPDLEPIAAPLTKIKPIQRYTIRDLHHSPIKCVEWSKNGMKLFSGDKQGIVVLTEFDFIAMHPKLLDFLKVKPGDLQHSIHIAMFRLTQESMRTQQILKMHISKSQEILNEAYDIVQIAFSKPWLLISTVYRAIICEPQKDCADNKWKVLQIGKKDRKLLSDFGVTFYGGGGGAGGGGGCAGSATSACSTEGLPINSPSILCSRPGFRIWLSDLHGNVAQTFLFKDSIDKYETGYEIPILNPTTNNQMFQSVNGQRIKPGNVGQIQPINFGKLYIYKFNYVVTHNENIVYFLNLQQLKIVATIKRLRNIKSLIVHDNEIFILEGSRSIVRIANAPEPFVARTSRKIFSTSFNILHQHQQQQQQQQQQYNLVCNTPIDNINNRQHRLPIEFEADEETILNADECFELPPIECIDLKSSLELMTATVSPPPTPLTDDLCLLQQDKLLLEHSRKVKIFEKINKLDYEPSILYKSGHHFSGHKTKKKEPTEKEQRKKLLNNFDSKKQNGIVEIAQQAEYAICNDDQGRSQPSISVNSVGPTSINFNKSSNNNVSDNKNAQKTQESLANTITTTTTTTRTTTNMNQSTAGTSTKTTTMTTMTTKPYLMDASFCSGVSLAHPQLTTTMTMMTKLPITFDKDLLEKEKYLAEILNIEPVKLDDKNMPLVLNNFKSTSAAAAAAAATTNQEMFSGNNEEITHIPIFQYPVNYLQQQQQQQNSLQEQKQQLKIKHNNGDDENTTIIKKMHFLNNLNDNSTKSMINEGGIDVDDGTIKNYRKHFKITPISNLSDDMKKVMISSDNIKLFSNKNSNDHDDDEHDANNETNKLLIKSLKIFPSTSKLTASREETEASTSSSSSSKLHSNLIHDIKELPNFMTIPNLWKFHPDDQNDQNPNKRIFKRVHSNESNSSSEDWELL